MNPVPPGCTNLANWARDVGTGAPQPESAHDAMTQWDPATNNGNGNHYFGGTIRSINGAIECVSGQTGQVNRINYYTSYRGILGAGDSVGRDTCF
jgi:hypothetical protein